MEHATELGSTTGSAEKISAIQTLTAIARIGRPRDPAFLIGETVQRGVADAHEEPRRLTQQWDA